MRNRIYFPIIGLTVFAALAVLVWRDFTATRASKRALEAIRADSAEGASRLRQLAQRLAAAVTARDRAQVALTALKQKPPAAPVAKTPAPPMRLSGRILELIRSDPEAETLFLATRRADLAAKYGPLIRALKLTPEAAKQFQDAFIRREEDLLDLSAVVRTQGAGANVKSVLELQDKAQAEYESRQRTLLGETGYQQLQDYERTAMTRGMVSAIAGVAAVEHVPFTPQQADALVQAIANASEYYRKGSLVNPNDVDWATVEAQARLILSPEQFTVFTTMDPGPSRGGLLQTRMYALVIQATQAESRKSTSAPGTTPRN